MLEAYPLYNFGFYTITIWKPCWHLYADFPHVNFFVWFVFIYYPGYYTCKSVEIIRGQGWCFLSPERICMYIHRESQGTINVESFQI